MYPTNRTKRPSRTDPEYVVYFYESGISQQYQKRQKNLLTGLNYGPSTGYDFSSDLVGRTGLYRPMTVESIISHGYFSVPKSDPVEAMMGDRKHTSRLGLDDIIGQIRHRYEVYESNIYGLEISKCSAVNSFYAHEAYHGPVDSKLEYSVCKRIDKLYENQRDERINLWRDVSRLKLLLPERAQEYLSAYRKVSILEDNGGDAF